MTIQPKKNYDPARCQYQVLFYQSGWPYHAQCQRKHRPDSPYCKQHDPEEIKARQLKSDTASNAAWNKRMLEVGGATFFAALKKIADGDNNPRETASEAIKDWRKYDR